MAEMSDLAEFSPQASFGPTRELDANGAPTGVTKLGRLTTTQEQRREAISHVVAELQRRGRGTEGRVVVKWSRGAPTVLEVACTVERLGDKRVLFADKIREYELSGAEIPDAARRRTRDLFAEVAEMAEKGAL